MHDHIHAYKYQTCIYHIQPTYMNTYTNIHEQTHEHTWTHTRTYMTTYTNIHNHIHEHTWTHTTTYMNTYTNIHEHIHAHKRQQDARQTFCELAEQGVEVAQSNCAWLHMKVCASMISVCAFARRIAWYVWRFVRVRYILCCYSCRDDCLCVLVYAPMLFHSLFVQGMKNDCFCV